VFLQVRLGTIQFIFGMLLQARCLVVTAYILFAEEISSLVKDLKNGFVTYSISAILCVHLSSPTKT
jgi:hypothetical protein